MVDLTVIVTGPRAAGKTLLAGHLTETWQLEYISAGDTMRQLIQRSGEQLGATTSERALAYMRRHGFDTVAAEIVTQSEPGARIVVDGPRAVSEVDLLRSASRRSVVIWVTSSSVVRFVRTVRRGRARDETTWPTWLQEEKLQRDMGLTACDPTSFADIVVTNESNVEQFLATARDAIAARLAP